MEPDDWVSVAEFQDRPSARIVSARLSQASVPNRVWGPQPPSCFIWVPPDRASEARQILSEVPVSEKELTELALAEPPPDDLGSDSPEQEKVGNLVGKAIATVGVTIILGIGLVMIGLLVHLARPCTNTVLWELSSPDALLKVSVFRRQCSGAGSSGGVSLLTAGSFINRTTMGNLLANVAHPERLSISWEGSRSVVISHRADDVLTVTGPWFITRYGRVDVRLESNGSSD